MSTDVDQVVRTLDGVSVLTSKQVAARSGISHRRVDYWTRRGLITPVVEAKGSGTQRLYDESVIDEIKDLLRRINNCPLDHGQPGRRK